MLSGLDIPTKGSIFIDGQEISRLTQKELTQFRREKLGFIFQQYNLLSTLTVKENVELGYQIAEDPFEIDEILKSVDILDQKDKFPNQMSGGQQQRVGIARAMASNPDLILFDEPTSALDPELVGEVLSVIKTLAKAGNTMIIVTHEMKFAKETADKIVFMENGEIIMEDSPEVLFSEKAPERIKNFTR